MMSHFPRKFGALEFQNPLTDWIAEIGRLLIRFLETSLKLKTCRGTTASQKINLP